MTTSIKITPDPKKFIADLSELLIGSAIRKRVLTIAADLLAGKTKRGMYAAEYPPETDRNKPPGHRGDGRWYQRGFGTRFTPKGARIGGRPYYKGFTGTNTSEDFQGNWKTEINDMSASVFTGVSYAPFLLDTSQRPAWVVEVGWRSTEQIAEEFAPVFESVILAEIDKIIKG